LKKAIFYLLKLTISGGFLYLVFSRIDVSDLSDAFSGLNGWVLIAAFFMFLIQSALNAKRWMVVMGFFGAIFQFQPLLRITFISLFVNQGLPSFIGGDALRVYWLNREEQQLKEAVHSVLVDRIIALIGLAAFMLIGAPGFIYLFGLTPATEGVLLLSAVVLIGILVFFCLPTLFNSNSTIMLLRELIEVSSRTKRLLFSAITGKTAVAQALAIHGLSILAIYLLALGFGLSLSFWELLIVIPPVILISVMPVSIAGWGVRESAMIVALGMLGVPVETALAISLTVGGLSFLNGLCGLPLLILGPERFVGSTAEQNLT
jgi:glycosyltransferase 2 family protein